MNGPGSGLVRLLLLTLLLGSARAAEAPKPLPFAIRWVAEKASAETEDLSQTVTTVPAGAEFGFDTSSIPPTSATIVRPVEKTVLLDSSAIRSARVDKDPVSGKPQIMVQFTPEGTRRFAEITRAARDRKGDAKCLAILIDGKLVMAPRVLGEIQNGQAMITGQFDLPEAERLARHLNDAATRKPSSSPNSSPPPTSSR